MRRIFVLLSVCALAPAPVAAGEIFSGSLQMSEAGLLLVDAKGVMLSDINIPPASAMCSTGKASWPCGRIALAALKSFVGNKDVVCVSSGLPDQSATCFLDGKDVSLWMLTEGWAVSANLTNRSYVSAGSEAANMRKGIWRAGGKPPKTPWNE